MLNVLGWVGNQFILGGTAVSVAVSVLLIWIVGPRTTYLAIANTG